MVVDDPREVIEEGRRLLTGEGVEPSPRRAAIVLEAAAKAGSGRANTLLAVLKASGVGGHKSWSEALDYLETAARLGEASARDQLALLTADQQVTSEQGGDLHGADPEIWRQVRTNVDLRHWLAPQPAGLLSRTPQIAVFPRFIPHSICRWLISRGEEDPQPALVYDEITGALRPDPLRTNSVRRLGIADSDLVTLLIQARIAASTGLSTARMEGINLLRYDVGQTFAGHVDFLDPAVPLMKAEIDMVGQRIATFLIYLNDDFDGGQTEFPAANLRYRGKPGDAILFYNVRPDGEPDPDSAHAGLPPTRGRKWLLSQWIRDKPQLIL